MDTVVFDRLQTMTTFHAMIVSARRKSLMDVARIPDRPTNDTHVWGGKRIGKQEGRNSKVSQDRCFFSKSRVRCPLNRNVGKVKLILSFSAYLSFLLFIFLSLSRFRCNPIATSWSSVRVDALSNRWEKVWSVACNRIARLYSFLRPFCAPRL